MSFELSREILISSLAKALDKSEEYVSTRARKKRLTNSHAQMIIDAVTKEHAKHLGKVKLNKFATKKVLTALHNGYNVVTLTPEGYHPPAAKRRRTKSTTLVNESSEVVKEMQAKIDQAELQLLERDALIKRQAAELECLKKELEATGRVGKLFKRISKPTRVMSTDEMSGKCWKYGPELNALAVSCLAEGVSAADLKRVLDCLAVVCEMLVTDKHRVPNVDWFSKLRLEMRTLNDEQLTSFVRDSEYLTASYDETSMHARKLGCLGLTNQVGQYMSVSFQLSLGRTGVDLAQEMFEAIDKLALVDAGDVSLATMIRQKLVGLITDRSRVQESGNRHFVGLLNAHPDRLGMQSIVLLCCLMHMCSNCERYFTRELSDDTMRMFALLRRIFGCRQTSAFNKHGLTHKLARIFEGNARNARNKTRIYESDLGARFGTFVRNGRALLIHEEQTKNCLVRRSSNQITSLQRELIGLMEETEWSRIRLEASMTFIAWQFALEEFHAVMSKPQVTLGTAKLAMDACFRRFVCKVN